MMKAGLKVSYGQSAVLMYLKYCQNDEDEVKPCI